MPIYEYGCSACGHRAEILHGINDAGPSFCPACGAEGTLRKGISAPAVVFKGSGWAKLDRRSATRSAAPETKDGGSEAKAPAGGDDGATAGQKDGPKPSESTAKPAKDGGADRASTGSAKPASSSDGRTTRSPASEAG